MERRLIRAAAEDPDAHRRLREDQKLASILNCVELRVVGHDSTITWRGKRYQIAAEQIQPTVLLMGTDRASA